MRDRAEDQVALVMIRHGATKSNREHRYLGTTEEPLCEEGINELLQYQRQGCYPGLDRLFVSPMARCIQTAALLYPALFPICIDEWREIDFGAFEGKDYRELQGDARYQTWIDSGGALPFPQGESREVFRRRCVLGFEKMLRQITWQEGSRGQATIGMVMHGGTIMALLSRYCGGDYFDYQAANGRGYRAVCHWGNTGPRLTGVSRL